MNFSPVAYLSQKQSLPPSVTFITFSGSTNDQQTYTGITANSGEGLLVMGIHWEFTPGARSVTGVTVNGNSATIVGNQSISNAGICFSYYRTTQSSNSISFGFSGGSVGRMTIGIWRLDNIVNDAPHIFDYTSTGGGTSLSLTEAYHPNDVGIALQTNTTQNTSVTWTNATERYDFTSEATAQFTGADYTLPDANNYTISTSFSTTGAILGTCIWH